MFGEQDCLIKLKQPCLSLGHILPTGALDKPDKVPRLTDGTERRKSLKHEKMHKTTVCQHINPSF